MRLDYHDVDHFDLCPMCRRAVANTDSGYCTRNGCEAIRARDEEDTAATQMLHDLADILHMLPKATQDIVLFKLTERLKA